MKKLVVSVGIIALGSSVLQALETGALNAQQSKKAWSVSASLRGFYDDNFNSQSGAAKESSTGVEVRPTVDFGFAGDQSSLNVGYDFTARYYEKAVNGSSDHSDFTHNFNLAATHAVSERVRLNASESFVVGQEPDLQRGTIDNPQRITGDNVRNYASVGATVQATSLVGFGANYNNTIVDYDDDSFLGNSARLDRMEQTVGLNARFTVSPQTTGILGTQIGRTEYARENERIDPNFAGILASFRDSRSLVLYVGAEHEFNSNLTGSLNVGGQRVEFPNNPTSEETWTPWVEASADYQYQTKTKLAGGVSYSRSPSDTVEALSATDFVRDTKVAAAYASISHEIAAHLTGTGSIRYQNVTFEGGLYDGRTDTFMLLGLGLAYEFNPNLEGNIGYSFDDLGSDIPARNYNRNKVYVGVTAKY